MPRYYFEEVQYHCVTHEVRAKDLDEAKKIFDRRQKTQNPNKKARDTIIVDTKIPIDFLFEVKDEAGKVVWTDSPEGELPRLDEQPEQQ